MKRTFEVSIAAIFILPVVLLVPNNRADAQAKLSASVRFLSSEEIRAMMDLGTRGSPDEGRPDYPVIMSGWRMSFDQPWLSVIFDHPLLWFVQEAAVASLRNYSEANSRSSHDNAKLAESSAVEVSKNFFRRVLLNPFNHKYMPNKTAMDLDVGDTGAVGVRGIDIGVLLRFNCDF